MATPDGRPEVPRRLLDPEGAIDRYRRTGDPAAFGALFDATAGDLHRAALAMLPDAVAAEDAERGDWV